MGEGLETFKKLCGSNQKFVKKLWASNYYWVSYKNEPSVPQDYTRDGQERKNRSAFRNAFLISVDRK